MEQSLEVGESSGGQSQLEENGKGAARLSTRKYGCARGERPLNGKRNPERGCRMK
jgi:hypothetical protein